MTQNKAAVLSLGVLLGTLCAPLPVAASQEKPGFTAVAGTDKAVVDERKQNNTALAVAAGLGTLALFTIGLTATNKRTRFDV